MEKRKEEGRVTADVAMKEGMHKVQRRARVRRCNREPVWRRAVNGGIEVQCGGGVEVQAMVPSFVPF